jgi:chorismate mutase
MTIVTALALTTAGVAPESRADVPSPLFALVDAAAQRLQTAEPVSAYKWKAGGAVDDPAREKQVIDAVAAAATVEHVDPAYVKDVFRNQIDATDAIEHARFSQWKLDPASAPAAAPELSASRSAIDTLNRTMVDEIAAQWDWLHSPTCSTDLDDARNAVINARQLDGLYQQALSFATHSYCQ